MEFVCQQNSLEELLRRLQLGENGELKPFEAVLRVKVTRGVPVESEIVALRGAESPSASHVAFRASAPTQRENQQLVFAGFNCGSSSAAR